MVGLHGNNLGVSSTRQATGKTPGAGELAEAIALIQLDGPQNPIQIDGAGATLLEQFHSPVEQSSADALAARLRKDDQFADKTAVTVRRGDTDAHWMAMQLGKQAAQRVCQEEAQQGGVVLAGPTFRMGAGSGKFQIGELHGANDALVMHTLILWNADPIDGDTYPGWQTGRFYRCWSSRSRGAGRP